MAFDNKTQVVITARDDTAAGLASAQSGLAKFGSSFAGLANPIALAGTAITAASASLVASVKSAIDTGDQFNKLSQKTGIAVESLSALAYAGDLADVNIESLATGIKKLSVNMAEAASNTKSKAAEAFSALGVAVKDANGNLRASDAVIGDVADKFANMKDGAGKTALAVALFGKAGADLIPLLNQGSKGIADMTEEAKKLGLVMTGQMAKDAEEFNDNIKKLSLSMSALGRSIAADLLGPLAQYTKLVVEARKEGAGLMSSLAIGLRADGADSRTLNELRERAASLQGTISFLTQGGQTPNDPIFGTKLKNSQAELAILQKQIRERMAQAQEVIPPFVAGAQAEAPTIKDGDAASKAPKKKTDLDRMLELGKRNLAASKAVELASVDDDEEARLAAGQTSKRSLELAKKEADATERLRQQYINLADPLNKYRVQLDEINTLRAEGKLTAEQAIEAEWQVNEAMDKTVESMQAVKEAGTDTYAELAAAVKGWGDQFTDTLADMVMTGKASFSDLANSVIRDLLRIQIQKRFTNDLVKSGTSFLDDIFGSFGGGETSAGSAGSGFMASITDAVVPKFSFAGGGYTGDGSRSGGLDGQGGFLAMMHPKESVIDHAQGGAAGGVTIVQHLNFAVGIAQTVRAEVMNLMPQIQAASQSALMESRLRGGAARLAFKG